eukprot:TRINITY_DN6761_c0_g1_i1.p1 TRINITY_DN6761_c0_g1~~TRINITY_DN6761_c0_g1_i1.p1  ORF type:complete len:661 (-),score=175.89 TRINITY_DN6761_c0_g1_i1:28-1782(-)
MSLKEKNSSLEIFEKNLLQSNEEVNRLGAILSEKNEQNNNLIIEIEELNNTKLSLSEQIDVLSNGSSEELQNLLSRIEEYEEEIKVTSEKLTLLTQDIESEREVNSALKNDLLSANEKQDQLTSQIQILHEERENLTTAISQKETDLEEKTNSNKEYETMIDLLKEEKGNLECMIREKENIIENLTLKENTEAPKDSSDISDTLRNLQNEIDLLHNERDTFKETISSLDSQNKDLTEEFRMLKSREQTLLEVNETLSKQVEDMISMNSALNSQMEDLSSGIKEIDSNNFSETEKVELMEVIDKKKDKIRRLKSSIVDLTNEVKDKSRTVELSKELDHEKSLKFKELESKVKEQDNQVQALMEKIEKLQSYEPKPPRDVFDEELENMKERFVLMEQDYLTLVQENLIYEQRDAMQTAFVKGVHEEMLKQTKLYFRVAQELKDLKRFASASLPKDQEIQVLLNELKDYRESMGAHQAQNAVLMENLQRFSSEAQTLQGTYESLLEIQMKRLEELGYYYVATLSSKSPEQAENEIEKLRWCLFEQILLDTSIELEDEDKEALYFETKNLDLSNWKEYVLSRSKVLIK